MSKIIETNAKNYLINQFSNERYRFFDRNTNDENGFDLWMEDKFLKINRKIELKATGTAYNKNSDIFQRLYFSAKNEVTNFEAGNTLIIRIFLENSPPKIFILDNSIFNNGAKFEAEYRAKIVGKINYDKITEIN